MTNTETPKFHVIISSKLLSLIYKENVLLSSILFNANTKLGLLLQYLFFILLECPILLADTMTFEKCS